MRVTRSQREPLWLAQMRQEVHIVLALPCERVQPIEVKAGEKKKRSIIAETSLDLGAVHASHAVDLLRMQDDFAGSACMDLIGDTNDRLQTVVGPADVAADRLYAHGLWLGSGLRAL